MIIILTNNAGSPEIIALIEELTHGNQGETVKTYPTFAEVWKLVCNGHPNRPPQEAVSAVCIDRSWKPVDPHEGSVGSVEKRLNECGARNNNTPLKVVVFPEIEKKPARHRPQPKDDVLRTWRALASLN